MKAVYSLTLLVIFSLVSFSHSQTSYTYSIYNNGTCTPVKSGQCIPCSYYTGSPVYYFQLTEDMFGDVYAMSFYDSACSEEYSYVYYSQSRCSSENAFENCQFFGQVSSISTLSLTLTSTEPVVVSLLGDNNVYTQISSNKVSAQGERLGGVQIHSGGKNFFVEQQVSETQYSTNIGVFTLGKSYTHTPFTFTVTESVTDLPLPPAQSDLTVISFSPFFSAQVTDDNTYSTFHEYDGEIDVYIGGSYNLDGLVFKNPFYSIYNMTFFPPFQNNNYGDLVFQLEASSSPFLTAQCYHYDGYTFDTYECYMGSISGIFSGSFLSFSLDEFGEEKIRQPDEMAFSLF